MEESTVVIDYGSDCDCDEKFECEEDANEPAQLQYNGIIQQMNKFVLEQSEDEKYIRRLLRKLKKYNYGYIDVCEKQFDALLIRLKHVRNNFGAAGNHHSNNSFYCEDRMKLYKQEHSMYHHLMQMSSNEVLISQHCVIVGIAHCKTIQQEINQHIRYYSDVLGLLRSNK